MIRVMVRRSAEHVIIHEPSYTTCMTRNWKINSNVLGISTTFELAFGRRVSEVVTVTGILGSWSQNAELSALLDSRVVVASRKYQQVSGGSWWGNAELSSLLDLCVVVASRKCQQSQGSGGVLVALQNCRHLWTCWVVVNRHRERGFLVAKRLKSANSQKF